MRLKFSAKAHRYTLDGRACTGISALGKVLDDTKGLEYWLNRHIAYGIALNPDLQNLVVSHWNESDLAAKRYINDVCEQAVTAAKAGAAANTGTAIHRTLERQDAGETGLSATPTTAAAMEANRTSLEAAGLTPEPGMSEVVVVWPDERWAGRFDRCYRAATPCPECGGTLLLGDIKSGANAIAYPAPIIVQLAGYALAPYMSTSAPGMGDWEISQWEPLPADLCRHQALIVAIPADSSTGTIHTVDLEVGRLGLDLVKAVKAWRGLKHSTDLYGPVLFDQLTESVAQVNAGDKYAGTPAAVAGRERAAAAMTPTPVVSSTPTRDELVARVGALKAYDGALAELAKRWPDGVPTFKQADQHTITERETIAAVLTKVEGMFQVPFPDPLSELEPVADAAEFVPADRPVYADEAEIRKVIDSLQALDRDTFSLVQARARQEHIPNLTTLRVTDAELAVVRRLIVDNDLCPEPAA